MIGEAIAGYQVIEKLGCGGFGCVYKGQHPQLRNRKVAIKVFTGNVESEAERTKFFNEAAVLDQLSHPNILPILDVGIHNDTLGRDLPFLITEYAPHGSLLDYLRQKSGPLPLEEALDILSQIGKGLQYAHELSIVHCDLKPENLLFNSQRKIVIADFGIAVVLSSAKTKQGNFAGSLPYMAPEQFDGKVSKRTDQYALACIAYELFTGQPPFSGDRPSLMRQQLQVMPPSLRQFNASLPDYIDKAVLKALSKERSDRYSSVSEFLTALQTRPSVQKTRLNSSRRGHMVRRRTKRRTVPYSLPPQENEAEMMFPDDEDFLLDEESDRRSRLNLEDVDFNALDELFPDEEEEEEFDNPIDSAPRHRYFVRKHTPNSQRIVRRYAPDERRPIPQPSVPARSSRRPPAPRYILEEEDWYPDEVWKQPRSWPDGGLMVAVGLGMMLFCLAKSTLIPQNTAGIVSIFFNILAFIGGSLVALSFFGAFISSWRQNAMGWTVFLCISPGVFVLLSVVLGFVVGMALTAPICILYALSHPAEDNWSLLEWLTT